MHAEDLEHGMDAQWRHADVAHRTDLWDSVQDARSEARYVRGRGTGSVYPWDEWLDGSIWRLTQGPDFPGNPRHFQALIYRKAKERGLKVTISLRTPGEIVMQARAAGEEDT